MKSSFKLYPVLALMGALLCLGCQSQAPTGFLQPGGLTNSPNMVINFEGTSPLTVNPYLAEPNTPGNIVYRPGSVALAGGPVTSIMVPGANGTGHALAVSGPVTSTQLQLTIPLDTLSPSGFYDASFFSGIKFYLLVNEDDNTTAKFFSIPVGQTMAKPLGICDTTTSHCYDHYGYNYTSTNGQWQLLTLNFSVLKRAGWGTAPVPDCLCGVNIQQFVQLQWQENGSGTNTKADFAIDEVQFY